MRRSAAETKGLHSSNLFSFKTNHNLQKNLKKSKDNEENQINFKKIDNILQRNLQKDKNKEEDQIDFNKRDNNENNSEENQNEDFEINSKEKSLENENEDFINENHKESEIEDDYLEEEEENEQEEDDILSQNFKSKKLERKIINEMNKKNNRLRKNKKEIKENNDNKKSILDKKCKSNKNEQQLTNKEKEGSPFCLETYNFNYIKEKICSALVNLRNCLKFFKKRKYNRKKINFNSLFVFLIIFIAAVVFTYFCFTKRKKESFFEKIFSSINNFFNLKYDFRITESISFFNLKKIASYLQFSVSLT
jgi:hypothetical protein